MKTAIKAVATLVYGIMLGSIFRKRSNLLEIGKEEAEDDEDIGECSAQESGTIVIAGSLKKKSDRRDNKKTNAD